MSDLAKLDRIGALSVPPKADLLLARHAIQSSPELQRLFDQAATEGWDVESLSNALHFLCPEIGTETARYLAEEFEARDKTQSLLVSLETGQAVAQVPPDAFYQPDPVAREDTDKLATPLTKLKPEVEAAIIQHHHGRAEESSLTVKLQTRARSSELQKAEGDARFRIATRSGRKSLAAQLLEELPTLLQDHRGACGRLLSRCRVNEPAPSSHNVTLELTLFAHASMLVADALANNFRHDVYGSFRERIRAGWTRTLARAITTQAHRWATEPVGILAELGTGLLIAEPNVIHDVRHPDKLLVPEALATILDGDVYLALEPDHQLDGYESEARWYVDASVSAKIQLAPEVLRPLIFTDVVESGVTVEVF